MMLPNNKEGVEMVEEKNGKYAFFMESASIQYLVERRCKLSQVWMMSLSRMLMSDHRLEVCLIARDMALLLARAPRTRSC